jgi:diguanylate cyclase (GGDEF)-like protein
MTWDGESRDRQRQLLDLLLRLELLVLNGSPVEPLHRTVASDCTRLVGADGAVVLLLEEQRWELAASAGLGERDASAVAAHLAKSIAPWVQSYDETLHLADREQDQRLDAEAFAGAPEALWASLICAPLSSAREGVTGILVIGAGQAGRLDAADAGFVDELARAVATEIYAARLYRWAVTDPLTGLRNRSYLAETLPLELARHRRYGLPFSLALIDVDQLGEINELHGRQAGDAVLAELARRSEALLRDVDVLARYGGGQFALLLPSTPLDGAHLLAERLRMQIVSEPYQVGDEQLLVSVSIGVVALRDGDQRAPHLIARADRALFHAKDQGRNRVAVSGWALDPF